MCLIRFIHLYWVSFPLWPSISRVYRDVWVSVSASQWSGTPTEAPVTLKAMVQVRQRDISPLSLHSVISANSHSLIFPFSRQSLSQNTVSFPRKAPTPWISFYSIFRDLSCFPQCMISLSDFQAQTSEGKRQKQCHPFPFINSLSEFAQVTHFPAAAEQ